MLSVPDAENAETGYRFEIVCRFPYRIKDFGCADAETSWFFARARAYSSNALICTNTPVRLGSIVTGVVTASYGCRGRANLDARSVVTDVFLPHPVFSFLPLPLCGVVSVDFTNGRNLRRTPSYAQRILFWTKTLSDGAPPSAVSHTLCTSRAKTEWRFLVFPYLPSPYHWCTDTTSHG